MSDLSRLPGPVTERWEWQQHSACAGLGTDRFFHPEGERGQRRTRRVTQAKAVCEACPVKPACAAHALRVKEPYGVWGGLSESDREEILAGHRAPAAEAS
jgi:WhiB family redox-sensing transcriptional regulator